jgi:hypothetical protein
MRLQKNLLVITTCLCALATSAQTQSDVTVGSTYDIVRSIDLRDGPGEKYPKKINQKASDVLRRVDYLSVAPSTTVKVLDVKGKWAEIQVTEPAFLADTHRGWIPLAAIKRGKVTRKLEGWVEHTCLVYAKKDTKSQPIGFLPQRAGVSVVDDADGWLEIRTNGLAPAQDTVMDVKTNTLLGKARVKPPMYIEAKNFKELPP